MPTLVLIPGLLSDDFVWAALAQAAEPRMPVFRALPTDENSIPGMAKAILAAVDGDIIAVGHSLGGRIAMEIARQAPARVKGLVLANTGHNAKRDGEEIKRQQMIDLGNEDMEELAAIWLPPMLSPEHAKDPALMAALTDMVLRTGAQVHERQIRALVNRPDAGAYLKDIACPVLLIAATEDAWSPVAQHEEIADKLADHELAVIRDAGHFAPVEQPVAVASTIMDWLERRFAI